MALRPHLARGGQDAAGSATPATARPPRERGSAPSFVDQPDDGPRARTRSRPPFGAERGRIAPACSSGVARQPRSRDPSPGAPQDAVRHERGHPPRPEGPAASPRTRRRAGLLHRRQHHVKHPAPPQSTSAPLGFTARGLTTELVSQHLLYWAPVPVISALRFLFPKFGGDPILLQYALRVLEHHPVEVTFFYIPQVVQALRSDALGTFWACP